MISFHTYKFDLRPTFPPLLCFFFNFYLWEALMQVKVCLFIYFLLHFLIVHTFFTVWLPFWMRSHVVLHVLNYLSFNRLATSLNISNVRVVLQVIKHLVFSCNVHARRIFSLSLSNSVNDRRSETKINDHAWNKTNHQVFLRIDFLWKWEKKVFLMALI